MVVRKSIEEQIHDRLVNFYTVYGETPSNIILSEDMYKGLYQERNYIMPIQNLGKPKKQQSIPVFRSIIGDIPLHTSKDLCNQAMQIMLTTQPKH